MTTPHRGAWGQHVGMNGLRCIDPATLSAWLAVGDTVVIDVREPAEHQREHIAGARLMPLSRLDAQALPADKRIVLCCASGCRSKTAARRLGLAGLAHLDGGIYAWMEAGLPVVRAEAQRFSAVLRFGPSAQLG